MQPLFFNYSLGCFVLCSKFRFTDIHKVSPYKLMIPLLIIMIKNDDYLYN